MVLCECVRRRRTGQGLAGGRLKAVIREHKRKEGDQLVCVFSPITYLLWAMAQKNGSGCRLGSPNWHSAKREGVGTRKKQTANFLSSPMDASRREMRGSSASCGNVYGWVLVHHFRISSASSFPLMRSHCCPFDLFVQSSSSSLPFLWLFSVVPRCCLRHMWYRFL